MDFKNEETDLICQAIKSGQIEKLKESGDNEVINQFMWVQRARALDKVAMLHNVQEPEVN